MFQDTKTLGKSSQTCIWLVAWQPDRRSLIVQRAVMTSKCYFAVEGSWLDPWVCVNASCSAFIVRSFFCSLRARQHYYVNLNQLTSIYPPAVKAQRRCRCIALLSCNHGAKCGWVANATPRPLCLREGDPVPPAQEAGWPQGRSGRVRMISPSWGIDPWTVQPVASRYTD